MNKTYISLDLAFRNLGVAVFDNRRVSVYRIKWCQEVPGILEVGDLFYNEFCPRFERALDAADYVVLEKPWINKNKVNGLAVQLVALYNCIVSRWGYKCSGYAPSIKASLYRFRCETKAEISEWARGLLTALRTRGLVADGFHESFLKERKNDDMADALFLLTHHLRVTGPLAGLNPVMFKSPEAVANAWTSSLPHLPPPGPSNVSPMFGLVSETRPCINSLLIGQLELHNGVDYGAIYIPALPATFIGSTTPKILTASQPLTLD